MASLPISGICIILTGEVFRVSVRRRDGKRPLGRPRHRWEDNIKMDLHEVISGGMDWIAVAQDRNIWRPLVNAVKNFRFP